MSHQPFPKEGVNLIKNTARLKDSQVTAAHSPEHSAQRSASAYREHETQTPWGWLLEALGSHPAAIRHGAASTEPRLTARA